MEKIISCCGVVCSDCKSYQKECGGCPAARGKAYWLQYVDADCCPIYQCCVEEKQFAHCGACAALPCEKWHQYNDPTVTDAERDADDRQRVALLKSL